MKIYTKIGFEGLNGITITAQNNEITNVDQYIKLQIVMLHSKKIVVRV